MNSVLIVAIGVVVVIMLVPIRVQRLKAAGHIGRNADGWEIAWSAFLAPIFRVLWAGVYEMIRTAARGTRQKPPFGAFLLAWVTGRVQSVTREVTVTTCHGDTRVIQVTEHVKPPRPAGRPRKYPEGWRRARLTGRPRGRPRKALNCTKEARHDK